MSKIFGKRKGKRKGTQDFREQFASATLPTPAVAAVPRTAVVAGSGGLGQTRPFSSLPPPDIPSDDTDSSLIDYQRGKETTPFSTAGLSTPVLRPPNEFDDEDEDSSRMEDEVRSQMVRQSMSPVRTENVSRHSPAASLRASATMTSQRSMGRTEPNEEVRSQLTQLSMSHSNRSMEHQMNEDDFDATETVPHSLEPSELRRSPTGEYRLSGQQQLSRQHQQLQQPQRTGQHQVSRQHQQLQQPQFTGQRQLSATDSSDLIPGKRDKMVYDQQERIQELENELWNMNKYVDAQKNEIQNLLKTKEDVGETPASSQVRIGKVREEVETLKTMVHRLNAELDTYQKKFRKLASSEMDEISSLPIKGPKPSWLVNTKYLAPLLVAYDDRLREKESIIETYENKIAIFQQKVDEILKENNRLHIRLEQTDAVGPISMTEWRQFQEQCKLVLEENQLLMEQLDIQQNKEKDIRKTFLQESSKLAQRASVAETEKAQLQLEVDELRAKVNGLKQKYDEAVIDNRSKMNMEEHIDSLSAIKQTAHEDKLKHAKELAEMAAKVKVVEVEKDNLAKELDKANATIKQLEADIVNKLKAEKKYKKEIEFMQIAVNDSEMLSAKVKQYLASVLKTAEVTAKERDTLAMSVQEQEKAKMAALKKLITETADIAKIKDKIKAYNQKKKEKLDKMANRLKEQDDDFNLQRQEYEREIQHLQQIVRDKDEMVNVIRGEKKVVLEDLETMWQAATKDNQRMQETIRQTNRKLQDHISLRTQLVDDPKPSTALNEILKQCGCDDDDMRVQ